MEAAGGTVVKHYRDLAFMGFAEVIKNLPAILRNLKFCKEDITQFAPDVLVLIDYPGFNLRLARTLHEGSLGGKIIYYISPQVWAWNRGRIPQMERWLDLMLCIFPFEAELYEQSGLRTIFVGHPMIEDLATKRTNAPREPDTPTASAIAASLPLARRTPRSRSRTVMRSPGRRPICDSTAAGR